MYEFWYQGNEAWHCQNVSTAELRFWSKSFKSLWTNSVSASVLFQTLFCQHHDHQTTNIVIDNYFYVVFFLFQSLASTGPTELPMLTRNLYRRTEEHAIWDKDSATYSYQHLNFYSNYEHIKVASRLNIDSIHETQFYLAGVQIIPRLYILPLT